MAPSDFSPDEAKTAGNTLCINEDFGKIWRKRCKPDVRGEILNRLLSNKLLSRGRVKSLIYVGDNVADVLDAYREADEIR